MPAPLVEVLAILIRSPTAALGGPKKSPSRCEQGWGCNALNAVITLRHLLREVKQGMTASRLSFAGQDSRDRDLCNASETLRRMSPVPALPPYPASRPRRLRRDGAIRALVRESQLAPSDLIYPVFLLDG